MTPKNTGVEASFRNNRRRGYEGLIFACRLALCGLLSVLRPGVRPSRAELSPPEPPSPNKLLWALCLQCPGEQGPPSRSVSIVPSLCRLYLTRHLSHLIYNVMTYGPLPTRPWKHRMLGEWFGLYVYLLVCMNLYDGLYIHGSVHIFFYNFLNLFIDF